MGRDVQLYRLSPREWMDGGCGGLCVYRSMTMGLAWRLMCTHRSMTGGGCAVDASDRI
jgi:hypothetical protein